MYSRDVDGGGNKWVPSERFERVGPNKDKKETPQRESSKPNTQMSNSSASSSKDKSK